MPHLRHFVGRSTLRALFLASASFAVAGGLILATAAEAAPVVQAAPAFASDRLSVEVVGSGPDVILIPGFASSREVWRAEAERLRATHRVHLVQLAGFAGEPWTHGDGAFVQPMADELARYVREAAMTTPVWAIYAADDDGGPSTALADGVWGREYASLPGVRLIRVDGSRHFIMADQPERFAELVDQFLAD